MKKFLKKRLNLAWKDHQIDWDSIFTQTPSIMKYRSQSLTLD